MKKLALVLFSTIFMTTTSFAREQIQIVGSSTVYPFATIVAENSDNKVTKLQLLNQPVLVVV